MPPKKKHDPFKNCETIQGERFNAPPQEDVFDHNWWEIFCFPYILCGRLWDCFVSLCSGTNQCLVYWMGIQWIVCKITQMTTPDAMIFPYYFYMFCQVVLLTAFFILIWIWFGRTVLTEYFDALFTALKANKSALENTTRLSFRRYCFRKSEIFDTAIDSSAVYSQPHIYSYYYYVATFFVDYIIHEMLVYMDLLYFTL